MTTLHIDMPPELLAEMRAIRADLADLKQRLGSEPEYLTTYEVAEALKCSTQTVRKRARDGSLPIAKRVGAKMLFDPAVIAGEG